MESEGFGEAVILSRAFTAFLTSSPLKGTYHHWPPRQNPTVSSCCGNQISCWPPCPQLSGSDGLWTSNGPQRVLQFSCVWSKNRDRIPVGVPRLPQEERRDAGPFSSQFLSQNTLWAHSSAEIFSVFWGIKDEENSVWDGANLKPRPQASPFLEFLFIVFWFVCHSESLS